MANCSKAEEDYRGTDYHGSALVAEKKARVFVDFCVAAKIEILTRGISAPYISLNALQDA